MNAMFELLLTMASIFACIAAVLYVVFLILAENDKHEHLKVRLSMASMIASLLSIFSLIAFFVVLLR
jgi:hypothetical protein